MNSHRRALGVGDENAIERRVFPPNAADRIFTISLLLLEGLLRTLIASQSGSSRHR